MNKILIHSSSLGETLRTNLWMLLLRGDSCTYCLIRLCVKVGIHFLRPISGVKNLHGLILSFTNDLFNMLLYFLICLRSQTLSNPHSYLKKEFQDGTVIGL